CGMVESFVFEAFFNEEFASRIRQFRPWRCPDTLYLAAQQQRGSRGRLEYREFNAGGSCIDDCYTRHECPYRTRALWLDQAILLGPGKDVVTAGDVNRAAGDSVSKWGSETGTGPQDSGLPELFCRQGDPGHGAVPAALLKVVVSSLMQHIQIEH